MKFLNKIKNLFSKNESRWVENKDKKATANSRYLLVKCEEGVFLFTEKDILRAEKRAEKNPEDTV
jgi:hypothetical protein